MPETIAGRRRCRAGPPCSPIPRHARPGLDRHAGTRHRCSCRVRRARCSDVRGPCCLGSGARGGRQLRRRVMKVTGRAESQSKRSRTRVFPLWAGPWWSRRQFSRRRGTSIALVCPRDATSRRSRLARRRGRLADALDGSCSASTGAAEAVVGDILRGRGCDRGGGIVDGRVGPRPADGGSWQLGLGHWRHGRTDDVESASWACPTRCCGARRCERAGGACDGPGRARAARADVGVAVTGIAGPVGGSGEARRHGI